MAESVPLSGLLAAHKDFSAIVGTVADALFLVPMSEGGWSVRDTVAHLVGWNREMVTAGRDVLAGRAPAYYAESGIDYRDINARFVAAWSAKDKVALLADLAMTLAELEAFVAGLDPELVDADHGVAHYRQGAATVGRMVDSLASDYQHHTQEIMVWLDSRGAK